MSVTHLSVDRSLSDLWDFSTTIDLLGYDFMQQALLAMVLLGVVPFVREHGPDPGHDGEGGQEQALEQERAVDVGRRGRAGGDRHAITGPRVRWYLVPRLPRSVGLGPRRSPPRRAWPAPSSGRG